MILLVFVAVLWVVVLAPSVVRRIRERGGVGSVDHFHHQLELLGARRPQIGDAGLSAAIGRIGVKRRPGRRVRNSFSSGPCRTVKRLTLRMSTARTTRESG